MLHVLKNQNLSRLIQALLRIFSDNYNFKSLSVTAPSDALVTCAAYFASTPLALTGANKAHTIFFSENERQAKPGVFGAELARNAAESALSRSDEIIFL
jgi:hypothetical protein